MLTKLPRAVASELAAGMGKRREEVAAALASEAAPAHDVATRGAPPHDAEECLRILMVRLWPRFVRGKADREMVRQALQLLAAIGGSAETDDLRFFDAFNNFWEHWPRGLDPASEQEFARRYLALLSHHLDWLRQ